jgi:hypothetical protein
MPKDSAARRALWRPPEMERWEPNMAYEYTERVANFESKTPKSLYETNS